MQLSFRQLRPAADLALFVREYWVLQGDAAGGAPHPIFPDGRPELVFNLGAPVAELGADRRPRLLQPPAIFVGQMTGPVHIAPSGRLNMVGVKLAPWGAAAFIDGAAGELRNRTVALGDGWEAWLEAFAAARDAGGGDDASLAASLDRLLRRRLEAGDARRLRRLTAVAGSLHGSRLPTVDAWSRALGCSARTLERHFDTFVGLAPKEFARVRRFQRALRLGTERTGLSLAAVAAGAGYTDQAHLGRDFHEFAGCAPSVALPTVTGITTTFVSD